MTNRQLQILSIGLAAMFIMPASFKLLSVGIAIEHFAKWGLPIWLMHFIGVSELAGAIGLLVPQTRLAAAFSLFLLMVGGLVTHLVNGELVFALMPIFYGAGLVAVVGGSPAAMPSRRALVGTAAWR